MSANFKAKIIINSTLTVKTGLHVGTGDRDSGIGEIAYVVNDPKTAQPIIPGSSLKGKMRSSLEFLSNKIEGDGEIHTCNVQNCEVCRLYGRPANKADSENGSSKTRLLVRDAKLINASNIRDWKTSLLYSEIKAENTINRLTSSANPRFIERVPAGAEFNVEMVYNCDDTTKLEADLKNIKASLDFIEDDYLGGNGSRGYGKVEFSKLKYEIRCQNYYLKPEEHNQENCETCKSIINIISGEKDASATS